MSEKRIQLVLYMAKCLAGSSLVFLAANLWAYHDFGWCLISVLLVLTPDRQEAVPLALTRIKANFVAASVSVLFLLLMPPGYLTITLALMLTILLCYVGRLMDGSRSALAAVIIIMLHGPALSQHDVWMTSLQRLASVVVGCVVALLVTLVFHRTYEKLVPHPGPPPDAGN